MLPLIIVTYSGAKVEIRHQYLQYKNQPKIYKKIKLTYFYQLFKLQTHSKSLQKSYKNIF